MAKGPTVAPPAEEPVVKAYATMFQIVIGLSDNRQISFNSGFESDEDDAAVNARMDRIMRIADRQRAKYEIPELLKDIAKRQEVIDNLTEDRKRVDEQYEKDMASMGASMAELERRCTADVEASNAEANARILEVRGRAEKIRDEAQDDWQKRGNLGAYKPQGTAKAALLNHEEAEKEIGRMRDEEAKRIEKDIDAAIVQLASDISKAHETRKQWVDNNDYTFKRHQEGLAAVEEALADARMTAGG